MSQKRLQQIEKRIVRIKAALQGIGPVRPGSLTRQYRDPANRAGGAGEAKPETPTAHSRLQFTKGAFRMNTRSNSERLRRKTELVLPILGAASSEVIHHPQFRELYPEFLVTVHWMIRATVPLMRTALQRCHELEATDPVAAAMVPFLTQHIKAEMDHDEWLLQDLELIGVPRSEVLQRMPSPTVAAMIGAHYYWIHHHHPVAKLGQVAVMDGYPAPVEVVELMAAKTGYPREAFRTIERHCHLDI